MENTIQVITFRSVDGNWQIIHFWKALGEYFQLQYQIWKFVDVSKVYNNKILQKYDVIVTSYEFIRIQILSVTVHHRSYLLMYEVLAC